MFYNSFVTFKEWINKKFIDWRGAKTGQEGSLAEFARMVGVSHQVMTGWIYRGVVPKSHRTIQKLILAFDGEVYDILDIDPLDFTSSDDQLRPIAEMIRLRSLAETRRIPTIGAQATPSIGLAVIRSQTAADWTPR